MATSKELLDELQKDCKTPEDLPPRCNAVSANPLE